MPPRLSAIGLTTLSKRSSLTPLASAASLRVRLWSIASWAMTEAWS